MNLIQKAFKEAIENSGEVELRIRIKREDAVGEVYEKLKGLLLLFPPDRIQVVPIKELTPEEEQEIFEIAMSDYEGDSKNFAEMLIKVGDDEDLLTEIKKFLKNIQEGYGIDYEKLEKLLKLF